MPNGERKFVALVAPNSILKQPSSVGNSWVVTDEMEKCVTVVTAAETPVTVDVGPVTVAAPMAPVPGVAVPLNQAPVTQAQAAPQPAGPAAASADRRRPPPMPRRPPRRRRPSPSSSSISPAATGFIRVTTPRRRSTTKRKARWSSRASRTGGTAPSGRSRRCRGSPSSASPTTGRRRPWPTSMASFERSGPATMRTARNGASSPSTARLLCNCETAPAGAICSPCMANRSWSNQFPKSPRTAAIGMSFPPVNRWPQAGLRKARRAQSYAAAVAECRGAGAEWTGATCFVRKHGNSLRRTIFIARRWRSSCRRIGGMETMAGKGRSGSSAPGRASVIRRAPPHISIRMPNLKAQRRHPMARTI